MCIRRTFFYVVGKFVPFRFTTVKASKKKINWAMERNLVMNILMADEKKNDYKT